MSKASLVRNKRDFVVASSGIQRYRRLARRRRFVTSRSHSFSFSFHHSRQACRYPLMDASFLFSWIATLLVLWAVIPLFSFFCIPPSDENIYHCYSLFETLTDHGDTATSIAFVCFIFTLFIGLFMNCYLNCIYESGFGEPESSLKVLVASARLTWCFALLSFLSSIGMVGSGVVSFRPVGVRRKSYRDDRYSLFTRSSLVHVYSF